MGWTKMDSVLTSTELSQVEQSDDEQLHPTTNGNQCYQDEERGIKGQGGEWMLSLG